MSRREVLRKRGAQEFHDGRGGGGELNEISGAGRFIGIFESPVEGRLRGEQVHDGLPVFADAHERAGRDETFVHLFPYHGQLDEGAGGAGQNDECVAVLDKAADAGVEVGGGDFLGQVGVAVATEGVAQDADRVPARLAGRLARGVHRSAIAAGDDRPASSGDQAAELRGAIPVGLAGLASAGAEDDNVGITVGVRHD